MELTGEQLLSQPRQVVWQCLNDPDVLKACVPGCESLERTADHEYRVVMLAAIGPVKARFNGTLRLSDLQPPASYSLAFEGAGGAAGFGKGGARVALAERDGGGTLLQYQSSAQVGGKLAQIGSRLIGAVAKKLSDEFFERFRAELERRVPAVDA
ncbi:carbon monoxide dehydrogenase subunit G [Pigmentiphaga soli]|uniref:Carbon monoxide dehydrogenase subunit G n=1 Tax=Pigmentiphaga soli TaxID=1007095 RepID=A0ABP8H3M8_9BURK